MGAPFLRTHRHRPVIGDEHVVREERRNNAARALDFIHVGSRLMFVWSVFLAILEIVTFVGATKSSARLMDVVAMIFTGGLFVLCTLGVSLATRAIRRRSSQSLPENPGARTKRRERAVSPS